MNKVKDEILALKKMFRIIEIRYREGNEYMRGNLEPKLVHLRSRIKELEKEKSK